MIEPLTPAEFETLAAYARLGRSRAVAAERGTSWRAVRRALMSAYDKIGVHGAVQAFWALGWLRVPNHMEPPGSTPSPAQDGGGADVPRAAP